MGKKVKEDRKARMERLRLDVLTVIKELESCRNGEGDRVASAHQRDIMTALQKRGWSGFGGKWPKLALEMAVDTALQYHRRRGAIQWWPGHGWESKPVKDEGLQG